MRESFGKLHTKVLGQMMLLDLKCAALPTSQDILPGVAYACREPMIPAARPGNPTLAWVELLVAKDMSIPFGKSNPQS
jgi:hypothetical protein